MDENDTRETLFAGITMRCYNNNHRERANIMVVSGKPERYNQIKNSVTSFLYLFLDQLRWSNFLTLFWSSTTNTNNTDNAWNVNFNNGNVNNNNKTNNNNVRCTR